MSPLTILLIAVIIAIIWELAPWVIRRWRLMGLSGFHRWLKDPDYRRMMAEELDRRRNVTIPDDVHQDTIQAWVMSLAGIGDESYAKQKLELAGMKAEAALVAALSNPAFLVALPDDSVMTKNGLDEVFDLLRDIAPPSATPALVGFVDHPDVRRVKSAALLLGCIADERGVEALKKALTNDDDYVRSYAQMGLSEAQGKQRGNRQFWQAIYCALIPLIDRSDRSVTGYTAGMILGIDPEAGGRLLMEQYCTTRNKRLQYTLSALTRHRIAVPVDLMDRLVAELEPQSAKYPWEYAFGELLRLMAVRRHPGIEMLAIRHLEHEDENVREGAADALVILRGMASPASICFERIDEVGFEGLTEAQQVVYCTRRLLDEVNNGGLSQYLGNSSGKYAHQAVAALEAIKAPVLAGHLSTVLAEAFGAPGPSPDYDGRMNQVAALTDKQDAAIEAFDGKLYHSEERIETLLMLYALDHANDFLARPSDAGEAQQQPA